MRVWFSGPRIGLIRPGVSFGAEDFGSSAARRAPGQAMGADFVYVISGGPTHVKVGMSSDPTRRLSDLQTASPHMLELAFTVPTYGNAYTIEQEAHRILNQHRLCGEWFAVSKEMAVAAIYAAADRTGCSLAEPIGPPIVRTPFWPQTFLGKLFMFLCVLWVMGMVQRLLGV